MFFALKTDQRVLRWLSDHVNPAVNRFYLWASGVSKLESIASDRYIHSIAITNVEFVDRFTVHTFDITEELTLNAGYCNTGRIAEVFIGEAEDSRTIHILTNVKAINA